MKLRPILFQTPMVQAIKAGTKTQTRRLIKNQYVSKAQQLVKCPDGKFRWWIKGAELPAPNQLICPYGVPGDVLLVRETYGIYQHEDESESLKYFYKADATPETEAWRKERIKQGYNYKYIPSIHMPYAACRLFLEITDVRAEPLQDISEEDAWAEGCKRGEPTDNGGYFPADEPDKSGIGETGWDCARDWYADLWESINGDGSWDGNPWVWVVEFKQIEKPV